MKRKIVYNENEENKNNFNKNLTSKSFYCPLGWLHVTQH